MNANAKRKVKRIAAALDAGRLTAQDLRRWKRAINECEGFVRSPHAIDSETLLALEERAENGPPIIADADQCARGIEWLYRIVFTSRGAPARTGGDEIAPEWVRNIIANVHAKRATEQPHFTFVGWWRDHNTFGSTRNVLPCYRLHDREHSFAYVARPWQAGGRGLERC